MHDLMTLILKISLAVFMAGNLLDMGLRLRPQDAIGSCGMVASCSSVCSGALS